MKRLRTPLIWGLLVALALTAFCVAQGLRNQAEEVSASSFMDMIGSGDITKVTFTGADIVGERSGNRGSVKTRLQEQAHIVAALEERNIPYSDAAPPDYTIWIYVVIIAVIVAGMVLPLLFLGRMLKNGPLGGGKTDAFSKHKAVRVDKTVKTTFADVAGIDEAKEQVEDIIRILRDPGKYSKLGGRMPKGVLLVGPHGVGKTLLARALAGEAGVPFFSCGGADFVEMFVGVGASRVRSLFEDAKKNAPCIVFVDEIDAVGKKRQGFSYGGGSDEKESTLNALLEELDGFEQRDGIIVIGATNRPEVLDGALLRPGRFDRVVEVPKPDINGREKILGIHARKVPLAEGVDLRALAKGVPGMCGADLENLINEAALLAGKEGADAVGMPHFEEAKDRVQLGAPRRSLILSEKQRRVTAVHEIGHVIAGWFNPHCDPLDKVSGIPRNRSAGVTLFVPDDDVLNYTKEEFLARVEAALGGYLAEDLVFGTTSTGVSHDLLTATQLVEAMVRQFAMGGLGLRAFTEQERGFTEYDLGQRKCSERKAREIDEAIDRILKGCEDRVRELLKSKRDELERLAEELMEREILDRDEVAEILGPRSAAE